MNEDKLVADLKQEIAVKDGAIKAKDEIILTQRQALKAKDETIEAKDETIETQRQALKAKDELLACSIDADWSIGQASSLPTTGTFADPPSVDNLREALRFVLSPRPDDAEIEISVGAEKMPEVLTSSSHPLATRNSSPRLDLSFLFGLMVALALTITKALRRSHLYRSRRRRVSQQQPEQKKNADASSAIITAPHGALVTQDIIFRYISFLDLKDFANTAQTCRAWSRAAKSVGNTYWRSISNSRWPEWAAAIEAELGKNYDFKSACKEKLRDEDHRLVEVWKEQNRLSMFSEEYDLYHNNPRGVPRISWLRHKGHIAGSLAAMSALTHIGEVPVPVFERYENAALAMYDDKDRHGGGFKDLLPIPSNITNRRKRDHDDVRILIKAIYFKPDGSLMDERPNFAYRNKRALFYSGTFDRLTPTQILEGVTRLASMETG